MMRSRHVPRQAGNRATTPPTLKTPTPDRQGASDSGYDEPSPFLPRPGISRDARQNHIDLTLDVIIDLTQENDDAPLADRTKEAKKPGRDSRRREPPVAKPTAKRSAEALQGPISEPTRKRLRATFMPADLGHVGERWREALREVLGWEKGGVAELGIRPYLNIMKRPGAKAVEVFDASTTVMDIKVPHLWTGGSCLDISRHSLRANIINYMLSDENLTVGKIYDSGNELRALAEADTDNGDIPNVVKLLEALSSPTPEPTLSLVDLKGIPNVVVRVPQLLREATHSESPNPCSVDANATAKFCCIDLHIDDGLNVFSECDAPKLWVFFPPTPDNVDKYYKKYDQHRKINSLWLELDEPVFGITFKDEAMYIPAGWIHATYSLENCIVAGTQWASPDFLDIATNCLRHDLKPRVRFESRLASITDDKRGLMSFLRSLSQAHRLYADGDMAMLEVCIDALQQICPKNLEGTHLSSLKELNKACPDCKEVVGTALCEACASERTDLLELAGLVKVLREQIKQDVPREGLACLNKGCKSKDGILGHLPVFKTK